MIDTSTQEGSMQATSELNRRLRLLLKHTTPTFRFVYLANNGWTRVGRETIEENGKQFTVCTWKHPVHASSEPLCQTDSLKVQIYEDMVVQGAVPR